MNIIMFILLGCFCIHFAVTTSSSDEEMEVDEPSPGSRKRTGLGQHRHRSPKRNKQRHSPVASPERARVLNTHPKQLPLPEASNQPIRSMAHAKSIFNAFPLCRHFTTKLDPHRFQNVVNFVNDPNHRLSMLRPPVRCQSLLRRLMEQLTPEDIVDLNLTDQDQELLACLLELNYVFSWAETIQPNPGPDVNYNKFTIHHSDDEIAVVALRHAEKISDKIHNDHLKKHMKAFLTNNAFEPIPEHQWLSNEDLGILCDAESTI